MRPGLHPKGATVSDEKKPGLVRGPLTQSCVHLCVDMQIVFAHSPEWGTPWMQRVLPRVEQLARRRPERTIFTRFIPPRSAEEAPGLWRSYYRRWESMTLERLPPKMLGLLPELAALAPPAQIIDKRVYSPWLRPELGASLQARGAEALVITGGETDVCVLAAVLGAVDRGYRVVIAEDGVCSSCDSTHDALMHLYHERYGQQVEVASSEEILDAWR